MSGNAYAMVVIASILVYTDPPVSSIVTFVQIMMDTSNQATTKRQARGDNVKNLRTSREIDKQIP